MVVASVYNLTVPIPSGVNVSIENDVLKVNGPKGELTRRFYYPGVVLSKKDNVIEVSCNLPRKKEKAIVGTWAGHINNMFTGVVKGHEYRMKAVHAHFPMKVEVKGGLVYIGTFLGEKTPRKAKIVGNTKVEVQGDILTLTGTDIEAVSQTAANIESATRIKDYDTRIFQDGIYITHKGV